MIRGHGPGLAFFGKMLFYSFFKTLVGQKVSVQLKNNVTITGTLVSVDQFLNLKLDDISVDHEKCPQLVSPDSLMLGFAKELFY